MSIRSRISRITRDVLQSGGGPPSWDVITNKPASVTNLSGTNSGDQDLSPYCPIVHEHNEYALSGHTHDYSSVYASISHNHDAAYAALNHNHNGVYSLIDHTHEGSIPPTVATLSGDQATGANVTPVTLTGLVFNYAINSIYRIWFMGRVKPGAATTGCGFQFDLSSAITDINIQFFHQLASTGTLSGGHSIADDASVGVSSGLPATSTYPVTGFGILRTGANTGTAQLRFRSETTAVITCKAGFTLVVEKLV